MNPIECQIYDNLNIQQLRHIIEDNYSKFLLEYQRQSDIQIPRLSEVSQQQVQFPGKQLRPLLLLFSAEACGTTTQRHIQLAVAVEMLHNATLMHDDVVDDDDVRRGQSSVRGRWGNATAVLCGDYYLAQVMNLLNQVDDHEATRILTQTVMTMCQGELIQLAQLERGTYTAENLYIDVIGKKTASLMAACCELGACGLDERQNPAQQWLHDFGYHYGLVYQIRDDLNDLHHHHDLGLPQAIDPQELISFHIHKAIEAISPLPQSAAKDALASLFDEDAPQPK